MTTDRFPDIEIYAKTNNLNAILDWINSRLQATSSPRKTGFTSKLESNHKGCIIPISITPNAAGKHFCSVTFDSAHSPWANDLECARDAFDYLKTEVRCSATGWSEDGDNSDSEANTDEQWWKISDEGEVRTDWRD